MCYKAHLALPMYQKMLLPLLIYATELMLKLKGIHPTQAKIKAIIEAYAPRNVTEVNAYQGMLTYLQ